MKSKTYLYNPSFFSAQAAASYCARLTDAGAASLVVFESRAEREQVIYELSQIPRLQGGGGGLPPAFWIGLRTVEVSVGGGGAADGGGRDAGTHATKEEWMWENGVIAPVKTDTPTSIPLVWGDRQPPAVPVGTYAFINMSSGYDIGLAHAHPDDITAGAAYPFVCQF